MTSAGGETLHPSLAEAVDECETLTRAAELVGAVSPEKSISEIDFDPDTVQDFVDDLQPSLVELDEAIEDAKRALTELKNGSDGEASDNAIAEAERELANLEAEREELASLIAKLNALPDKMDDIARNAASDIIDVPLLSAKLVLTGSDEDIEAFESLMGTTVEDGVRQACEEVAGICGDAQDELDDLAETFRSLSGEESDRSAGGGTGDDDSDDRGAGGGTGRDDDDSDDRGAGGGTGRDDDDSDD